VQKNDIPRLHADAKTAEKAAATAKTTEDADRLHALSKILVNNGAGAAKTGE
jgi:glucose-6-phosphate isomerase